MAIVAERGPEALTMPRLAEAADVAVGGLYRYFDGKDALLAALQVRAIHALAEAIDAHQAQLPLADLDAGSAALARVLGLARAWHRFRERQPHLHGLLDEALSAPHALLSDDDARAVDAALQPALARCAEALQAAADAGALHPGHALQRTHVLWAVLHGTDHFRKRDRLLPAPLHAAVLAEQAVATLLQGWGARPEPLSRATHALQTPRSP